MIQSLDLPILGLPMDYPLMLFVLRNSTTEKYACYCLDRAVGLACFGTRDLAEEFQNMGDLLDLEILGVSFESAREIAKSRPLPVNSLIVLDDFENPYVHFVK